MGCTIVGTGSYVPEHVVSNEQVAEMIPGWSPERISSLLGIQERRFLYRLDPELGESVPPAEGSFPCCGVDMAQIAAERALQCAGSTPDEIDALFYVTCTPDMPHFGQDSILLKDRLKLRRDALALQVDKPCSGALYMLHLAHDLIRGDRSKQIAIVASNLPSSMFNRSLYQGSDGVLSAYVFGDAAAAVIVRWKEEVPGIVASHHGSYHKDDVVVFEGGGARFPAHSSRTDRHMHACRVNAAEVKQLGPRLVDACICALLTQVSRERAAVDRFYVHPGNARLVRDTAEALGIRPDQLAVNADRYANVSSPGVFLLLDEDVRAGTVRLDGSTLACFVAPGAGMEYASHLLYL